MIKPICLIDVDGPLTSGFFEASCAALRSCGVPAEPDKIDQWNLFKSFGASRAIEAKARQILCLPGVATSFQPRRGAWEFVTELRETDNLIAVTSPLDDSPTWAHEREMWLCDLMGFMPNQIVSARDKSLIHGDWLLDDKEPTLVAWSARNPHGLAILWEEPHNRHAQWKGLRTNSFAQVLEWLKAFRQDQ